MRNRFYIDMDGTLARFHDEEIYLERMWEKGFFLKLKPFQSLIEGLELFSKNNPDVEINILSSVIDNDICVNEKSEWLNRHCGGFRAYQRIFPRMGVDKSACIPGGIRQTDILLDDYNKNLEEWEQAGGTAVKCKNNINHKGLIGELWRGELLDNQLPAESIAVNLQFIFERLKAYTLKDQTTPYHILKIKDGVALLQRFTAHPKIMDPTPYIVARGIKTDGSRIGWQWGNYYSELEQAKFEYELLTQENEIER